MCPQQILKILCCKCKRDCTSRQCSCRNLGLFCTDICDCTEICENHIVIDEDDDEYNVDEDDEDEF